jgi:hypothetical protein
VRSALGVRKRLRFASCDADVGEYRVVIGRQAARPLLGNDTMADDADIAHTPPGKKGPVGIHAILSDLQADRFKVGLLIGRFSQKISNGPLMAPVI